MQTERQKQFLALLADMSEAEQDALYRRLMKLRNKPEPTYQDAADALYRLGASKSFGQKGRDAIKAVLAKFGATHLQSIAPRQFTDLIAECEALQAA